jgi:DNA polymerase-3 subunit gamma/tau
LYVSLYRKYRPQLFKEVVGQDAAISLLRSSFMDKRLGHAYLFSGPRGCGKTTAARLLAKVVNCKNPTGEGEPCGVCESCTTVTSGEHMDVMEIDGASNRGIDQIRELKSHVGLTSFTGGTKVYILDEVHMLTAEAFNALLKTLEEPPSAVLFIFATTEPHKVPVTIRSRCQHIPFHRISVEDMVAQLRRIASIEGFSADEGALWEIARSADGALRDALSLMEQAVAVGGGELPLHAVQELFGGSSRMEMERFISLVRTSPQEASEAIRGMLDKGVSPERFLDALFPLLRDMWVFALWGEPALAGTALSGEEKDFLRSEAVHWRSEHLKRAAMMCASMFPRARMGLRAEVFSGLLFFELMSIFQDEPPAEAAYIATRGHSAAAAKIPAAANSKIAAENPRAPYPSSTAPTSYDGIPDRKKHTPARRADATGGAKEGVSGISSSGAPEETTRNDALPEIIQALCRDDLPLAAALIDVRVLRVEDSLVLDFSESSAAAKAVLTSPRAKFALDCAFGITEGRADTKEEPSPPAAGGAREKPYSREAPRAMTPEAISAYLGADILMSKHITSDDSEDEVSDITDL